jgi:uncharacterized membrane protein
MGNTPVMRPQLKGAEGSLARWRVAVTAAVLGWLLACLLLALGTWPLGIVVALALTVAAASTGQSIHARSDHALLASAGRGDTPSRELGRLGDMALTPTVHNE